MYTITYGKDGNEKKMTADSRKQAENLFGKVYKTSYMNGLGWTIKMYCLNTLVEIVATK